MKEWTFANGIKVYEVPWDFDLHALDVYHHSAYLGKIIPDCIDGMKNYFAELDNNKDPITDNWEDGCGNICTLNGW